MTAPHHNNNTEGSTMTTTKATDELLTKIAAEHWDGLETLERRGGDSLDFHETAVWSIKEALQQAFELGRQTADEPAPVVADAEAWRRYLLGAVDGNEKAADDDDISFDELIARASAASKVRFG